MDRKVITGLCGLGLLLASAAAGDTLWTRTYDGDAHSSDRPTAMVVDAAGNCYVTGYTTGATTGDDVITIKYGPDGTQLWVNTYNWVGTADDHGTGIALDSAGEVFVCGGSGISPNSQFTTIKYNAGGQQLWAVQWPGGNSASAPNAIAVDDSGNCYVTGVSAESIGAPNKAATIKYDGDGRSVWVAMRDGGQGDDEAEAITLDAQRNVYITGKTKLDTTGPQLLTVKYDTGGHERWVATYQGPGKGGDVGVGIAVDPSGNVYVGGTSNRLRTMPPANDIAVLKYDTSGHQLWVKRYSNSGHTNNSAAALALNSSGVYVTGSGPVTGHGVDFVTVKYDPSGNRAWVNTYDDPSHNTDKAVAIALDAFGYAYVTGSSDSTGTCNDFETIRISRYGVLDWSSRLHFGSDAGAVAIGLDALRNIYVTGFTYNTSSLYNVTTVKYESVPQAVAEAPGGRLPNLSEMAVSPNPVTAVAGIRYSIPVTGAASLKLYDATGALAKTLVEGRVLAGSHALSANLDKLARGVYLLRLATTNGNCTSKLILK